MLTEGENQGRSRFLIWATLILLLAALFRLIALSDTPPGLAQDETLDADIASFIREGQHALFFREGFGHEPLYHYWAAPFAPLVGDNMLAIRLPSIILGLLLVALAMAWIRRQFGDTAGLIAGTGIAVSWWPIIFSRIGIRPIMEPVCLLLMAWFWPRRPWLAGLFLGLAIYTYTGARVVYLIPVLVLAIALLKWGQDRAKAKQLLKQGTIVLLMSVIVSAPMQLTLFADPSLQQRVDQLAGPLDSLREGDFAPIIASTTQTLAVFSITGDPRLTYSPPNQPLFDPITAIFFYLGLVLALWRWRDERYHFALIWLVVTLLPSAITPQAPSTVRLVGAIPVVYLLPALGLDKLLQVWRRWPGLNDVSFKRFVALNLLLCLLGFSLARTIFDGFVAWSNDSTVRLNHYQATFLEIGQYHAREGDGAPLLLFDSFYEPIDHDSLRRSAGQPLTVRWLQTDETLGGALVIPAGPGPPPLIYIPEYAFPPVTLFLSAGLKLDAIHSSEKEPEFVVLEFANEAEVSFTQDPVTFNGSLRFLGSREESFAESMPRPILTIWEVVAPLPTDLAIFVHVTDEAGNLLTQHDGFDAAAAHLQPGDLLVQRHIFTPVESLDSLQFDLRMGVYTRGDNVRWPHDGPVAGPLTLSPTHIDN